MHFLQPGYVWPKQVRVTSIFVYSMNNSYRTYLIFDVLLYFSTCFAIFCFLFQYLDCKLILDLEYLKRIRQALWFIFSLAPWISGSQAL